MAPARPVALGWQPAAQEQRGRAAARRAKLRADLADIARLLLMPCTAQAAAVRLTCSGDAGVPAAGSGIGAASGSPPHAAIGSSKSPAATPPSKPGRSRGRPLHQVQLPISPRSRVFVVLPHAHVTPDEALGCLRFSPATRQPCLSSSSVSAVVCSCGALLRLPSPPAPWRPISPPPPARARAWRPLPRLRWALSPPPRPPCPRPPWLALRLPLASWGPSRPPFPLPPWLASPFPPCFIVVVCVAGRIKTLLPIRQVTGWQPQSQGSPTAHPAA